MGLFSKLIKDVASGSSALDKLKEAAQDALNEAASKVNAAAEKNDETAPARRPESSSFDSGIPAEENQYNFSGTYLQYFDKLFREEFPDYEISGQNGPCSGSYTYTFRKNGADALVVELKSEKSESQKLRRECERKRVKYLRYYYDHAGWWNTRSYVAERTRKALNG